MMQVNYVKMVLMNGGLIVVVYVLMVDKVLVAHLVRKLCHPLLFLLCG
jgi:hypothetical protein